MAEHYDLIVAGGDVIDGTGSPRRRADVGVRDGRVVAIGDLGGAGATRLVDASGCVVAPGVVDHHTHYDAQIFRDPTCADGGQNGVTTVVLANCGFGFAPCRPSDRERSMEMMESVEQIPVEIQRASLPWDWESFPEYLGSLSTAGKAVNAMSFVPLNALMIYVMGIDDAKTRRATDDEVALMRELLGQAMDAGAIGLSLSSLGRNNLHLDFDGSPMPTDLMPVDQVVEVAQALAERGTGVIQCLSGFPGSNPAVVASERLAAETGRPLFHNVIVTTDAAPIHVDGLAWLDRMRAEGRDMYGASFCHRMWTEISVHTSTVFDHDPTFRALHFAGSHAERLAMLADDDYRQRLRSAYDYRKFAGAGGALEKFTVVSVGGAEGLADLVGRRLGEVAEERQVLPVDLYADILVASGCEAAFRTGFIVSTDPEVVREVFLHDHIIPGGSDGGAHLKIFSGGHWATDMLVHLVRDEGVVTQEQAHHKFSGLPMQMFGVTDRGTVTLGSHADLIVYRLDELWSSADAFLRTHDLPGGDWRKQADAGGYRYSIVNGEVTFEGARPTGAAPGSVVAPTPVG